LYPGACEDLTSRRGCAKIQDVPSSQAGTGIRVGLGGS
jgi:hypothetical protein